jgi:hypothetical protein
VDPVILSMNLTERPSAFAAACAHAHAIGVGRRAVVGVPGNRWHLAEQPVETNLLSTFDVLSKQYQSVQLQDAQARILGQGRTATGTRMALASGVPPRGRPV